LRRSLKGAVDGLCGRHDGRRDVPTPAQCPRGPPPLRPDEIGSTTAGEATEASTRARERHLRDPLQGTCEPASGATDTVAAAADTTGEPVLSGRKAARA